MCPNGVEWKTLGEVCEIVRGASPRPIGAYLTTAADGIPWIKIGDVNPNSRFIESTVEKITAEGAAHSRFLHKGDFVLSNSMSFGRPYILKIDGCIHDGWVSISKFDKHLISEYLFYILKSDVVQYHWRQKAGKGSVANLNADIIKATPIPLPPLAIQTRIVEILDHFTNLTANLTAELNLRRKQFEHYREKLLSLDGVEGVEWKKLGEVGKNLDSKRKPITASKRVAGNIPYYGASGIVDYVEGYIFDGEYLLVSEDGANLLSRNSPIAFSIKGKTWVNNHAHIIQFENQCCRMFIEYFLNKIDLTPYVSDGAQPKLNQEKLNSISVPFPPLATQHSIVSILDKFTALIENIEKELALRQKQYEYYREELLRFGG